MSSNWMGLGQGDDVDNKWTDWRAILIQARIEAREENATVSEVLSAHQLAETRVIRQFEQEGRDQQASVVEGVIGAISQGLAMLRAGRKK